MTYRRALELGWRRTDPRPWRKTSARWKHLDGSRLEHCGHPTALWPWAFYDATGRMVRSGALREGELDKEGGRINRYTHGTAWPDLQTAMEWHRNSDGRK